MMGGEQRQALSEEVAEEEQTRERRIGATGRRRVGACGLDWPTWKTPI